MNKYEIYNLESGYLITIDDEVTVYDFYDVPKQIIDIIKQLEQENIQLKEQRQELRSWLEKEIDEYGNSDAWLLEIGVIKNVLSKINELEDGKNE